MPTQPEVTEDLGNGDYLVEGMSFQMGGYWIIDFTLTFDGQTDLVVRPRPLSRRLAHLVADPLPSRG
jgi:hypothetical protein